MVAGSSGVVVTGYLWTVNVVEYTLMVRDQNFTVYYVIINTFYKYPKLGNTTDSEVQLGKQNQQKTIIQE